MVKFGNYFISLSGAQWCSVFSSECVDLGSAYLRAPRWGGEDQVQGEERKLRELSGVQVVTIVEEVGQLQNVQLSR